MAESILVRQDASSKGSERTLAILEFLGRYRTGQSSSEIARALSLPVNSVAESPRVCISGDGSIDVKMIGGMY